jgi:hypothetical protein
VVSVPRRSWSHAPTGRAPAAAGSAPRRVVSSWSCALPGPCGPMASPDGRRGSPGTSGPGASAGALAGSIPSGPCASRVTRGGDDGARSATWRSAARMSSGRTAGITCRTTIRSIAFPAACVSAVRRSVSIVITAARASTRLLPLAVRRSTSTLPQARKASTARPASSGWIPGSTACQCDASSWRPARDAGPSITSITSIPSGRAASSRSRTSEAARASVRQISRYSASLAVPVGAAPA